MKEEFMEDNLSLKVFKGKVIRILKENAVSRKEITKIRSFNSKHLLREHLNINLYDFKEIFTQENIPIQFKYSRKNNLSFKSRIILELFEYEVKIENIQAIKRLSNSKRIWSYIKLNFTHCLGSDRFEHLKNIYEKHLDEKSTKKSLGKNQYAKIIYTPMGNKR